MAAGGEEGDVGSDAEAASQLVSRAEVFEIDFVFDLRAELSAIVLLGGSDEVDVRELVAIADAELPITLGEIAAVAFGTALFSVRASDDAALGEGGCG